MAYHVSEPSLPYKTPPPCYNSTSISHTLPGFHRKYSHPSIAKATCTYPQATLSSSRTRPQTSYSSFTRTTAFTRGSSNSWRPSEKCTVPITPNKLLKKWHRPACRAPRARTPHGTLAPQENTTLSSPGKFSTLILWSHCQPTKTTATSSPSSICIPSK